MTLYKCLLPDRVTPHAHVPWPVRARQWTPPATPVLCESGWHLATERGLSQHLVVGELWTAEGRGECVAATDKVAYEQACLVRLVATVTLAHIVQLAHDYAGHVAHLRSDVYAARAAAARAADVARAAAHYAAAAAAYYAGRRAAAAAAYAADARAPAAAHYAAAHYAAAAAARAVAAGAARDDHVAERRWQHDRILDVVGS